VAAVWKTQDTDEYMAIMMALNSPEVDVVGIVAHYGNGWTSLNYHSLKWWVHELKGRPDIPIYFGAREPSQPPLQRPATYANRSAKLPQNVLDENNHTRFIYDPVELFKETCYNEGVKFIYETAAKGKVSIMALSPVTDLACVVLNHPHVLVNIEGAYSQLSQTNVAPMTLNNHRGLADLNTFFDPLAIAICIRATQWSPPLKWTLLNWNMNAQLSDPLAGNHFLNPPHKPSYDNFDWFNPKIQPFVVYNESTIVPPSCALNPGCDPWNKSCRFPRSTLVLNSVQNPKIKKMVDAIGAVEGPFAQAALGMIVRPSLFNCTKMNVTLQQCPYPEWHPLFNESTSYAYNVLRYWNPDVGNGSWTENPCLGLNYSKEHEDEMAPEGWYHGAHATGEWHFNQVSAQLQVIFDKHPDYEGHTKAYMGPFVAGPGSIPRAYGKNAFNEPVPLQVNVCFDFANDTQRWGWGNMTFERIW